jgi:hypothetical protein
MHERITAVSVDLDGVGCYHAIHGLPPPGERLRHVVLERCLPRFLELFQTLGVRATFFVIGHQLEANRAAGGQGTPWLQDALAHGHELANHSFAHAYDLVTWSEDDIREDLRACDELLREVGAVPCGFRAPGYTHDAKMLAQVAALGYRYDSSALPSPPYYAAKLAVMGAMRLVGKRSQSMASGADSFFGQRLPHRLSGVGLWELPMSVTPVGRLPLIGTSLLASPPWVSAPLSLLARRSEYFHLELHGLDLADPERDEYDAALLRRQPELRVPLNAKMDRLATLLRARGPTQTLAELTVSLDDQPS